MGFANRFTDEPTPEITKKEVEVTGDPYIEPLEHRVGMYMNTKVARVKFISSKRFSGKKHILVDVLEKCQTRDGNWYDAHFNLWITVDDSIKITSEVMDKYALIEFRMYTLRDKELNSVYNNYYLLKRFELIEDEDADRIALEISNSIKPILYGKR